MIDTDKLRAIVESPIEELRSLAELAGGHPTSFYRGANFDDVDLRGQDLRGFNLEAATFRRARLDRHTKVDEKYQRQAGLKRRRIEVALWKFALMAINESGLKLEMPHEAHLGDLIEEATYERNSVFIASRAREGFVVFREIPNGVANNHEFWTPSTAVREQGSLFEDSRSIRNGAMATSFAAPGSAIGFRFQVAANNSIRDFGVARALVTQSTYLRLHRRKDIDVQAGLKLMAHFQNRP